MQGIALAPKGLYSHWKYSAHWEVEIITYNLHRGTCVESGNAALGSSA